MPAEAPILVVFGDFVWLQKKCHFPKTDSCNKRAFLTFRIQTMFVYLSKKCHFSHTKTFWLTTTQKHNFLLFIFPLSIFSYFLFFFSNIKRQKTKSAQFFQKPFFDTLTNCKKYVRTPYTLFMIFKMPKNTINLGKTSKTILDQVFTQLWTKFRLKKQIFDQVWLYNMYIYLYLYLYIYIYTYGGGLIFCIPFCLFLKCKNNDFGHS